MKFDTVFRGYDKRQVDAYIHQSEQKSDEVLRLQKERIFELVDENSLLKEQIKQYQMDEQAISKSLIESQRLAAELTGDAEKFAEITFNRAKIFYATWQVYSKTLMNSLSSEEVRQFSSIMKRIEKLMSDFEGDSVAATIASPRKHTVNTNHYTESKLDDSRLKNPVEKIVVASGAAIDTQEVLKPDKSLEEICMELGLIKR